MSFPQTYRAIKEMVEGVALETRTARAILRKAGLRAGTEGGSEGIVVLNCSLALGEPASDDVPAGFQYTFSSPPVPSEYPWFPSSTPFDGYHTTVSDLSSASQIKNSWVVGPGSANPNLNIRVTASLDATNWSYPTEELDDWRFEGANVNCGQWLTYTDADIPYENYPPNYALHQAATNALPGGWTTSGWRTLREEFRAEDVYLRWSADFSESYSDDPIYTSFDFVALGYGEIRVR